jgi:hypothetical protein
MKLWDYLKEHRVLSGLIILFFLGSIASSINKNQNTTNSINTTNATNVTNVTNSNQWSMNKCNEIEKRIVEYRQDLKGHYPNEDMLTQLNNDIIALVAIQVYYEKSNNNNKIKKDVYLKSKQLLPKVVFLRKLVFAKNLERKMLEDGHDMMIDVKGKNGDILEFKWALMSRPFVYQIATKTNFLDNAKNCEFKKVIFTDGFDSSWTYDLNKI